MKTRILYAILGVGMVVFAVVFAPLALRYYQDYRALSEWNKYVRYCEGMSDSIRAEDHYPLQPRKRNYIWMEHIMPPAIDEKLNFAEIPFWKNVFGDDTIETSDYDTLEKCVQEIKESDDLLKLSQVLEPALPVCQILKQALKEHPQCRYPVDWNGGYQYFSDVPDCQGDYPPHWAVLNDLYLLIKSYNQILFEKKDKKTILENIIFTLDLADTVSREPAYAGLATKVNGYICAMNMFEQYIPFFDDVDLAKLQERFSRADLWHDFRLAMMGHRAAVNQTEVYLGCMSQKVDAQRLLGLLEFNYMMDAFVESLDVRQHRFNGTSFFENLEELQSFQRLAEATSSSELLGYSTYILRFASFYEKQWKEAYNAQSKIILAEVACAMLQYYKENSRYPSSLEALRELLPLEKVRHDWVSGDFPTIKTEENGNVTLSFPGWDAFPDTGDDIEWTLVASSPVLSGAANE